MIAARLWRHGVMECQAASGDEVLVHAILQCISRQQVLTTQFDKFDIPASDAPRQVFTCADLPNHQTYL